MSFDCELLPQPGGFEGLGAVGEDSDALDLAVNEVIDIPGRRVLWDPAAPPRGGHSHESQDAIRAGCLESLDGELEVGTSVHDVGEETTDALAAVVRSGDVRPMG